MKILFITDLYPVKYEEQRCVKTLHNFVKGWRKLGYTVDVIKPNFILNSFLRKKPFYKSGKYDECYNVNYFTPFWFDIKDKLPKVDGYDFVVAHMPSGVLLAEKLDLPLICGVHCSDIEVLTNPIYGLFKKSMEKAYQKSKGIACRSEVLKRKFLELYPQYENKTFTCFSGIDCSIIERVPVFEEKIKLITCANLIERKNIDKLIDAVSSENHYDLIVVGDGKMKKKWEKINSDIKFLGRLKRENFIEKLQNYDIFILPSVGETFGLVYLEAMSQGCIVVATKDDGVDGIIKDGYNGFLTLPTAQGIRETLDRISKLSFDELNVIAKNSHKTILSMTDEKCCKDYLQRILKII